MEYSSDGYTSKVQQVKKKNYLIPIIIVIVVAIVAVVLIYYVTTAARTVSIEGESITVDNLSDYGQSVASRFGLESEDITVYSDGSLTVKEGAVSDLEIGICINYGSGYEYWQLQDTSEGLNLTYKKALSDYSGGSYTLSELCLYLSCISSEVTEEAYDVSFSVQSVFVISAGSYLWNGEVFDMVWEDVAAECYPVTVTAQSGAQYNFYVI